MAYDLKLGKEKSKVCWGETREYGQLSSAKNKISRFWPKPEGICVSGQRRLPVFPGNCQAPSPALEVGVPGSPAARIFLQLIADFVVYLGLLIRTVITQAALRVLDLLAKKPADAGLPASFSSY